MGGGVFFDTIAHIPALSNEVAVANAIFYTYIDWKSVDLILKMLFFKMILIED